MRRLPLLIAPLALAALAPRPARACSAPACVQAYFYPAPGETVPSNAPALVYRSARRNDGERRVTLTGPSGPVPVGVGDEFASRPGVELVPGAPLTPGAYTLRSEEACFEPARVVTSSFTVGPPAMAPTALGDLAGLDVRRGELEVADGAACSRRIAAVSVPIELTLHPSARPWAPLLVYRTLVDGQPWRPASSAPQDLPVGGSWRGRGVDEVYAACEPNVAQPGLAEGEHTVVMEARVAGTSATLRTPPLQVSLRCAAGGIDAGIVRPDAGPGDGPTPPDDGGAPLPPARDSGVSEGGDLERGEDGCRCLDPAGAGPGTTASGLLLGLAAISCRRSRRPRRPPSRR